MLVHHESQSQPIKGPSFNSPRFDLQHCRDMRNTMAFKAGHWSWEGSLDIAILATSAHRQQLNWSMNHGMHSQCQLTDPMVRAASSGDELDM